MALINCPDCNKQVSDSAKRCVNCGYPIRAKQQYYGARAVMSIIIIAIGLFLVLNGSVMPGAIWFGLFMVAFGGVVLIALIWSAATS